MSNRVECFREIKRDDERVLVLLKEMLCIRKIRDAVLWNQLTEMQIDLGRSITYMREREREREKMEYKRMLATCFSISLESNGVIKIDRKSAQVLAERFLALVKL